MEIFFDVHQSDTGVPREAGKRKKANRGGWPSALSRLVQPGQVITAAAT
jgi:hypothetical protein